MGKVVRDKFVFVVPNRKLALTSSLQAGVIIRAQIPHDYRALGTPHPYWAAGAKEAPLVVYEHLAFQLAAVRAVHGGVDELDSIAARYLPLSRAAGLGREAPD